VVLRGQVGSSYQEEQGVQSGGCTTKLRNWGSEPAFENTVPPTPGVLKALAAVSGYGVASISGFRDLIQE